MAAYWISYWGIISQHFTVCFSPISLHLYQKPIYVIIHLSPWKKRITEFAENCYCKLFFPFSSSDPSGSGRRRDLCGICPLRKVKGAAGIQNHLDLGFIRFSKGLWRHEKSGGLICCGGGLFATDTRHTIVLRMFFVLRTYSLQGRGSRGRGALSRGELQLPSEN